MRFWGCKGGGWVRVKKDKVLEWFRGRSGVLCRLDSGGYERQQWWLARGGV